jgi:hypothetical protein
MVMLGICLRTRRRSGELQKKHCKKKKRRHFRLTAFDVRREGAMAWWYKSVGSLSFLSELGLGRRGIEGRWGVPSIDGVCRGGKPYGRTIVTAGYWSESSVPARQLSLQWEMGQQMEIGMPFFFPAASRRHFCFAILGSLSLLVLRW